jgi:putative transcriptional regulator
MKSIQPGRGKVLISEPFLSDPNFFRSVVLLVDHSEEGSVGFVLNRPLHLALDDVIENFPPGYFLWEGGPVSRETLHVVHTYDGIEGASEILPGLYWSGDFDAITAMCKSSQWDDSAVRFLSGYSGWAAGQLDEEIAAGSWIVAECSVPSLMDTNAQLWKVILKDLGGKHIMLANAPLHPQLN